MTERTTADLESGIRETRDRMSENIDAIGEKLSPTHMKERAKEAIRHKAQDAGAGMMRAARENPLPAAMVLMGITWLMRSRPKHERDPESTPRLRDVKDKAQEKIGAVSHQVADKAKRTGSSVRHFFEENPLIASTGLAVLGAALGALLPHTRKEDRLLGRARDQIVDQAEGAVRHARDTFEDRLSQPM